MKKLLFLLVATMLYAKEVPYQDTQLQSDKNVVFGPVDAKMIHFGGYSTPECKFAISNDGSYFYFTKVQSTCAKMTNSKGVKIVCNSDKSVCKTRSELIDFVQTGQSNTSVNNSSSSSYRSSPRENLIATSMEDFSDYMIRNTLDNKCNFLLPSTYAYKNNPKSKHLNAKFSGACKNYKHNKVKIYYKGKLFATYEGKVIKRALPVGGTLTFVNGDKYKMGTYNGDRLITHKTINDWFSGIHVLHRHVKNSLSPDLLDIKLGINSEPEAVQGKNLELLGIPIHLDKTENTIILNYEIRPNNLSALTKAKYKLELEIETSYRESVITFGIGVSKRKTAYDTFTIELDRENDYMAEGTKRLREFTTYHEMMGVRTILRDFKTDVKVVSLRGE